MTTATPSSPVPETRAELQGRRAAPSRPRARRANRTNGWLAGLAVVFVLVAVAFGAFAFVTWQDANDLRDATKPLEARTARLHADVASAEAAIDRLTDVFTAIRAQHDATAAAVATANQAAQRFNNAQSGIAAALGDVGTVGSPLVESTAAVRTAIDRARSVLEGLADLAQDPKNG